MRRTLVSTLLFVTVVNSLLNKTAVWGADAASRSASRVSATDNIDMPGTYRSGLWEYQVVVTSPGSKSEGTRGRLLYAGKPVEDLHSGCIWMVKRVQGDTAGSSSVITGGKPQFISALGAAAGTVHRGVFENVLRVTGPGKFCVELEYRRDWQTDRPAEKTFTVTLNVQEEPVGSNKP